MKMTRLEWRYLQRIALDHPYFDTHELPLTEQEAKAIVEANVKMTGREFVDSVYEKLGMVRPKEEKKRFVWLRSIGELFAVPPIRKVAITVLVAVLMVVFFAATPAGRAVAESVIRYIATLFEDGGLIANRSDSEMTVNPVYTVPDPGKQEIQEQEDSNVYVNSFEEFITETGVRPTVLPFPYTVMLYDYDAFLEYLKLHTEYETPKGKVVTYQIWYTEDIVSSTTTGFTVYHADPSVYYSYEEDGKITVMKIYGDSVLTIITEDSYTVEEILSLLTVE